MPPGFVRDVRPYPYDRLPRWHRGDVTALRALVRHLGAPRAPGVPCLDPGFDALLGAMLRAHPGAPCLSDATKILDDWGASVLCAVLSVAGGSAILACDRPFALTLAQRCLGGPESDAVRHAPHGTLAPRWEGALAVLVARLLAHAFATTAVPVVRAVTDDLADALRALRGDTLCFWPWTLSLGAMTARAFAVAPWGVACSVPWPSIPRRPLGDVPVTVAIVAGQVHWDTPTIASLQRGEVIVAEGLHMTQGALTGEVILALGHPPTLARRSSLRGDRVEVIGPLEPFMEEEDDARLAELSVTVTLELARESFPLATISTWCPGEVVVFRTHVGDTVTLRANGRTIARGELVDVDGDIGVRILEVV